MFLIWGTQLYWKKFKDYVNLSFRYLNEKQKALIAAFAELDDEISGTVNGVDRSSKFIIMMYRHLPNRKIYRLSYKMVTRLGACGRLITITMMESRFRSSIPLECFQFFNRIENFITFTP